MKCDYKNSLRGCDGDGIAERFVIIHYNLAEYEELHLCWGCTRKICWEITSKYKVYPYGYSLYVFSFNPDDEYDVDLLISEDGHDSNC